jgi:putative ABC transport system permease protein
MEFQIDGLDARLPGARPNADVRLVVPGYFEAMGMSVVGGRPFDELDVERDRNVAAINETLAGRYFAGVDPVGRTLQLDFGAVDIVGVVADIKHDSLLAMYESEVYLPYGRPVSTAEMHIVVQSDGEPAAVAAAMTGALADLDPRLAPSPVVSIAELLWESVARPRFNTTLLTILAACGALLAAVGTYGIVAYTVSQRVREIGVRMALGADAPATVAMIVRQALAIVAGGAVLGIAGAFGASRLLRGLLFEIEPSDPFTYGAVLVAAVIIGLVAAWIPARRATRIHPVVALRNG